MTRIDTTTILAVAAIRDGDHELAREKLNELNIAELREVVAYAGMLSYLANETIDDKPRDLADESERLFDTHEFGSSNVPKRPFFQEGGVVDPAKLTRPTSEQGCLLSEETITALKAETKDFVERYNRGKKQ